MVSLRLRGRLLRWAGVLLRLRLPATERMHLTCHRRQLPPSLPSGAAPHEGVLLRGSRWTTRHAARVLLLPLRPSPLLLLTALGLTALRLGYRIAVCWAPRAPA